MIFEYVVNVLLLVFDYICTNISCQMNKTKVLEAVNSLPDEFSLEEIIERLIILEKIEKGMQQVRQGQVVTTTEAKKRLQKWLR